MSGDVADQPIARALLRHLAETRGDDDPIGSLARSVVSGRATLHAAAANPWHSEGLMASFEAAQRERDELTAEQRSGYERQAERLRHAGDPDAGGDTR